MQPQPLAQSHGQPGGETPVPPEKKRLSLKAKVLLTLLIGVPVGLVLFAVVMSFVDRTSGAYPGDCMQYSKPNNGKYVKCSSLEANTVVLKRYDVLPSLANCDKVPGAIATYGGTYHHKGKTRTYALCLGPHTPGTK